MPSGGSLVLKLKSLCIVDGDSSVVEDLAQDILKLPGTVPESEVFNYVNANLESLAMKLALASHLSSTKDGHVKNWSAKSPCTTAILTYSLAKLA
jgi:hypothetical protein